MAAALPAAHPADPATQLALEDILKRLGGLKALRFGIGQVTGNGTRTVAINVAHGAGFVPRLALAMAAGNARLNAAGAADATNFAIVFDHVDGTAWATAEPFYWVVAG